MNRATIGIAGAGIGGLTAALCFARRGFNVQIAEQAPELSEVGAGLQLSPNATHILTALGLETALADCVFRPDEIRLVSGVTLKQIASVPSGGFAEMRWGAPYGSVHRADLQSILLDAVSREPRCRLSLGRQISATDTAEAVAFFTRLAGERPLLVIGADGVWSRLRHLVKGAGAPRFSGLTAWRAVLSAEDGRHLVSTASVTAFLGPHTHLVAYPLRGGRVINMVAFTRGKNPGETWAARGTVSDRAVLERAFSAWNPDIRALFAKAGALTFWPLFEVGDGAYLSQDGNLALIGDAAHALVPFSAQGAAMAIEDAWELAAACEGSTGDALQSRLGAWQSARRERLRRVRRRTAFNRFVYHATGPVRIGRDVMLSLRPPATLAADLDWLYGWRATDL